MTDVAGAATSASPSTRVGDRVRIRRLTWRVVDVRTYPACELVTVSGLGAGNNDSERRFLIPFDSLQPLDGRTAAKWVARRHWQTAARALLSRAGPSDSLRAATGAQIDLLPYQLEPALAVVSGLGTRTLLADEVGLGKTIQAALIVAELRARGAADRVLILTPAGLREQWAGELRERFGWEAFIADSNTLRRRMAELPVGLNPWSTIPLAIASLDYVKRPEVLPAIKGCRWDVVIVDEAHGVATSSDRHAAAEVLCERSPYVLLVTATPHNGDRRVFQSLCTLGAQANDPLLLWRRSRTDVSLGVTRRIHRIAVALTPEERRMHGELARLARAVRAGADVHEERALALSVLFKRAYSSANSLAQSVNRRLAVLSNAEDSPQQLDLPLADAADLDAEDEPPAWSVALADDAGAESRLLSPVAEAAAAAARHESKLTSLIRLVGRLGRRREPAIIFTEFRDTLLHVARFLGQPCAVIHGGMPSADRRAALADFTSGRHVVLLATDAAAEGLNLHASCRVVINLELPWNPMRLEQRIGRVDRIGQHRTVHAFHLIARHTGEMSILDRLQSRLAQAREDVGAADPLGIHAARGTPRPERPHTTAVSDSSFLRPCLIERALDERARIAMERLLAVRGHRPARPGEPGACVAFARRASTRALLAAGMLAVVETAAVDSDGRHIASRIQGIVVRFTTPPTRSDAIALVPAVLRWLEQARILEGHGWHSSALAAHHAFSATRLAREHALAEASGTGRPTYQPGLFDRRAERQELAGRAETERASTRSAEIIAQATRASHVEILSPRVALVLIP